MEAEGHAAQPVGALIPPTEAPSASGGPAPPVSTSEAMESVHLLDEEVATVRAAIDRLKASARNAAKSRTHPGVSAFYNDEVSS